MVQLYSGDNDPLVQRNILQCMYGTSFTRVTQRCKRSVLLKLDHDHLGFDLKQNNCLLPSCISVKHVTFRDVRVFRPGKYGILCRLSKTTDEQCFSIILSSGKTLYFLSDSVESVKTWVNTGNYLNSIFNNMSRSLQREIWMWEFFKIADKNGDGKITLAEVKRLFKKVNLQLEEHYIKECFAEHDTDNNKSLSFDEFVHFYDELTKRPELLEIFNNYAQHNPKEKACLTAEELLCFLKLEQGVEDCTSSDVAEIVKEYEPCQQIRESGEMSVDGFLLMINSAPGNIFKTEHEGMCQDMTRSLSEYYIASSHNTYLMEGQLRGESSTTAYLNAFQRGCKCVELDTWDGSDGEPIIYHGYTLTTKVKFKDVIRTINDYAFCVSPYPVILSIENHCTVKQQKRMADIMKEIFEDKLLTAPVERHAMALPSPEALKHKIIIKGKAFSSPFARKGSIKKRLESNTYSSNNLSTAPSATSQSHIKLERIRHDDDDAYDVSEEDEAMEAADGTTEHLQNVVENVRVDLVGKGEHGAEMERRRQRKLQNEMSIIQKNKQDATHKPKKLRLCKDLSDMVIYFKSVRFPGYDTIKFYTISSFNEAKAKTSMISNNDYQKVRAYHQTAVSRVYPAGSRTNSSNYDPCEFWNCGVQMVAINYQTAGSERDIYLAQFKPNSNCGYILKPPLVQNISNNFNPANCDYSKGTKLTIEVISGQQLPKPKSELKGEVVDPYVRVEIYGIDDDRQTKETQWIQDNGFNPRWDEDLTFYLKVPELAVVRISVWDKDAFSADDFLGQYSLPVNSMATGYRHAVIEDENGKSLQPASIFLRISKEAIKDRNAIPKGHRVASSTSRKSVCSAMSVGFTKGTSRKGSRKYSRQNSTTSMLTNVTRRSLPRLRRNLSSKFSLRSNASDNSKRRMSGNINNNNNSDDVKDSNPKTPLRTAKIDKTIAVGESSEPLNKSGNPHISSHGVDHFIDTSFDTTTAAIPKPVPEKSSSNKVHPQ